MSKLKIVRLSIRYTPVIIFYFSWRNIPQWARNLLIHEVYRSYTTTHYSRQDSFGQVISSSQRLLPDNTQHSQQRDIHVPIDLRTHNLSRRAAAYLRFRPRGYWERHTSKYISLYFSVYTAVLISPQPDQEGKKLQRQKILSFICLIYNHNWRNISTVYKYNKTSIKRNILTIKQNTSRSRSG